MYDAIKYLSKTHHCSLQHTYQTLKRLLAEIRWVLLPTYVSVHSVSVRVDPRIGFESRNTLKSRYDRRTGSWRLVCFDTLIDTNNRKLFKRAHEERQRRLVSFHM